jgi:hypothetical protein
VTETLIEVPIGNCKICDAQITVKALENTMIQVSDEPYPRDMRLMMISKPLFCEDCKKALRKLLGRTKGGEKE